MSQPEEDLKTKIKKSFIQYKEKEKKTIFTTNIVQGRKAQANRNKQNMPKQLDPVFNKYAPALQYNQSIFKDPKGIPKDKREVISKTNEYPNSAIGLISMLFQGKQYTGTGFLISRNMVLTCCHNLFQETQNEKATQVKFYPGRNGTQGKQFIPEIFYFVPGYTKDASEDFGILLFKENIGDIYGYLGLDFSCNYDSKQSAFINGYPSYIWKKGKAQKVTSLLFGCSGIVKVDKQNNTISYDIPTSKGQSGSPILYKVYDCKIHDCKIYDCKIHDKYYAIGIHIKGNITSNLGVLLRNSIRQQINQWISEKRKHMDLYNKYIENRGVKQLVNHKYNLTHLNLDYNKITDKGVEYLQSAQWPNLKYLSVANNHITDSGLINLLTIVCKKWPKLQQLLLGGNEITFKKIPLRDFELQCSKMESLKIIRLRCLDIQGEIKKKIEQLQIKNRNQQRIHIILGYADLPYVSK